MGEKRFIVSYTQGMLENSKIIIDKETGVNYLYHKNANSGGLTPLLDKEGKPIISNIK